MCVPWNVQKKKTNELQSKCLIIQLHSNVRPRTFVIDVFNVNQPYLIIIPRLRSISPITPTGPVWNYDVRVIDDIILSFGWPVLGFVVFWWDRWVDPSWWIIQKPAHGRHAVADETNFDLDDGPCDNIVVFPRKIFCVECELDRIPQSKNANNGDAKCNVNVYSQINKRWQETHNIPAENINPTWIFLFQLKFRAIICDNGR